MLFWLYAFVALAGPVDAPSSEALGVSCEQAEMSACVELGRRYREGEGVPKDTFKATQLFRKACQADHAHGCMYLAEGYRVGAGVGVDAAKAAELYIKACELGDGLACRSVGDMFILGNGVRTDGAQAGLWYQMGCELGDAQACTGAGLWLERGDVVKADPDRARAMFAKACELGHPRGCTMLGIRHMKGADGAKRDAEVAASWFQKGCVDGHFDAEACRELGVAEMKGKGLQKSPEAAKLHLERACYANDPLGCRSLAEVRQEDGELDEALFAADRGCDMGDAKSCKRAEYVRYKLALQQARER